MKVIAMRSRGGCRFVLFGRPSFSCCFPPMRVLYGVMIVASLVYQGFAQDKDPQETVRAAIEQSLQSAGDNRGELQTVLDRVPAERKASAEFLIANMPERDLKSLKADFLLAEIQAAHDTLESSPWKDQIPQDIFLNNILPYVNINERRDPWRKDFQKRFASMIEGAKTPSQAAAMLNQKLFPTVNVKYSTQRAKADQSPYESIQSGLASCTGLSVLLIDACRSLAIPARFVGTPLWSDNSGNHSWVEIWDNGWHFTGAAEPSGDKLDQAWFIGRASTAKRDDYRHAIYAVSFQKTPTKFPLVWDRSIDYVSAVNVTDRYTNLGFKRPEGTQMVSFRASESSRNQRVVASVKVFDEANQLVAEGKTKNESFDANDHLNHYLKQDHSYRIEFQFEEERFIQELRVGNQPELIDWRINRRSGTATPNKMPEGSDSGKDSGKELSKEKEARTSPSKVLDRLKSFLSQPLDSRGKLAEQEFAKEPLTLEEARAAELLMVGDYQARMKEARKQEFERKRIEIENLNMRFDYTVFGNAPEGGHSLYISMHGGGGAPEKVNDSQWENQKRLYKLDEGVYVAPRAPTNTWNLWHEGHIDRFFDRLIEDFILFESINPDRVYLMGYSAGGDGVYQVAPRMADRFAAASMMAGHPNETSPLGLRNLPFTIHMGEKDGAYNRNKTAESWKELLADLEKKDPKGYKHFVKLHAGKGHWMDRQDAEALPWMHQFSREKYPERIVWKQDDVISRRFYWLATDSEIPDRALTVAHRDGQAIVVDESDLKEINCYLRDDFIDCDQPVTVQWGEAQASKEVPKRTLSVIDETLSQRGDPKGIFYSKITIKKP